MSQKNLLLISNGYGEDSFSSLLLEKLLQFTKENQIPSSFFVIPLVGKGAQFLPGKSQNCLLYTSPSPRDRTRSRMPSSA